MNRSKTPWIIATIIIAMISIVALSRYLPLYARNRQLIPTSQAIEEYKVITSAFGQTYVPSMSTITDPYWRHGSTQADDNEDYIGLSRYQIKRSGWIYYSGQIKSAYNLIPVSAGRLKEASDNLIAAGLTQKSSNDLVDGYTDGKLREFTTSYQGKEYRVTIHITPVNDGSSARLNLYLDYACKKDLACEAYR